LAYHLKCSQKVPGGQVRGAPRWFNFRDLVSRDCRRMMAHARKNWCSKLLTFIFFQT
jgi:hypothetical protein